MKGKVAGRGNSERQGTNGSTVNKENIKQIIRFGQELAPDPQRSFQRVLGREIRWHGLEEGIDGGETRQ